MLRYCQSLCGVLFNRVGETRTTIGLGEVVNNSHNRSLRWGFSEDELLIWVVHKKGLDSDIHERTRSMWNHILPTLGIQVRARDSTLYNAKHFQLSPHTDIPPRRSVSPLAIWYSIEIVQKVSSPAQEAQPSTKRPIPFTSFELEYMCI